MTALELRLWLIVRGDEHPVTRAANLIDYTAWVVLPWAALVVFIATTMRG